MDVFDLTRLVDHRNQALWDEVHAHYLIDIQESADATSGCFQKGRSATIYLAKEDYSADAFTHELLHFYMDMKKILIGASLSNTITSSKVLGKVFSPALLEHAGNCLSHMKMLPLYLEMGFEREKFLFDYDQFKCTDAELEILEQNYCLENYFVSPAVDLFAGKYFAIRSDPNIHFDYTTCLQRLKKIDEKLFLTLKNFADEWEAFDISIEHVVGSYYPLIERFYQELTEWMQGKEFV